MTLVLDVGNTDVTIGLHNNIQWTHVWRIPAVAARPEPFYGIKIRDYFLEAGISTSVVQKVVLSSVVPELTDKIINVTVTIFEQNPVVLGPDVYQKLPIGVLNPYEIGSDLVANAMAAFTKYQSNCIVVDFGTALTFTTIAKNGEVLGVAIAPGLKTAIKSLSQNTAKLFDVPLDLPKSVLGKNTVQAIQAGVLVGYEGLVTNMLQRIKEELNDPACPVVATGGLSSILKSLHEQFTDVEPNLTLEGLRLIGNIF